MDSIHRPQDQYPVDMNAVHWTNAGYTPEANLAVTRRNVRDQDRKVQFENYHRHRHFNLAMNPDQHSVPRRGSSADTEFPLETSACTR